MKIFSAFVTLLLVSGGSSARTVTWQEEVILNTGETIQIEREMLWGLRGGMGNPFDIEMRPTRDQVIRFQYRGKAYRYQGQADIRWIAISPSNTPALLAVPESFNWHANNNYYCVVPYYVQFNPDDAGTNWTWPDAIDPWFYNLPANVMANYRDLDDPQSRFTHQEKSVRDFNFRIGSPGLASVMPDRVGKSCVLRVDTIKRPDWTKK